MTTVRGAVHQMRDNRANICLQGIMWKEKHHQSHHELSHLGGQLFLQEGRRKATTPLGPERCTKK
eukprot:12071826-Ditylum_brightwellii.AAC.1